MVAEPFFTVPRSAVTISPRSDRSLSAWSIRATHTHRSLTVAWSTSPVPADASRIGTSGVTPPKREAAGLGADAVPFFVLDRRYGISGGQPAEACEPDGACADPQI